MSRYRFQEFDIGRRAYDLVLPQCATQERESFGAVLSVYDQLCDLELALQ